MALNKTALKTTIKAAFDAAKQKKDNPDAAFDELAGSIADAIDAFVKTGTVNSTVAGTCGAGPYTGTGTGTIS